MSLRCGVRCVELALRERRAWVSISIPTTGGAFSLFVAVGLHLVQHLVQYTIGAAPTQKAKVDCRSEGELHFTAVDGPTSSQFWLSIAVTSLDRRVAPAGELVCIYFLYDTVDPSDAVCRDFGFKFKI